MVSILRYRFKDFDIDKDFDNDKDFDEDIDFNLKTAFSKNFFPPSLKLLCSNCNITYYSETEHHLNVKSGEHLSLSVLTGKLVNDNKKSLLVF